MSVGLFLLCIAVHLFRFFDSTYRWYHFIFGLVWQSSFCGFSVIEGFFQWFCVMCVVKTWKSSFTGKLGQVFSETVCCLESVFAVSSLDGAISRALSGSPCEVSLPLGREPTATWILCPGSNVWCSYYFQVLKSHIVISNKNFINGFSFISSTPWRFAVLGSFRERTRYLCISV